jgi:ketosteroid isomerase-like protein
MEQISPRVARWKATWEGRDVDAIVAMYHPDATHERALVAQVYPKAGGTALRGAEQIRAYFAKGLARFSELRFDLVSVTESGARAAIEYRRHSNLDGANPAHVLELVTWDGAFIRAVRVFHF